MKRIAFVKRHPRVRVLKQAMGLKQTGRYHLTLVAAESYEPSLLDSAFDEIIDYNGIPQSWRRIRGMGRLSAKLTPARLKSIVRELDVALIHCQASPNTVSEMVIKHAPCPVVYDAYDYVSLRYGFDHVSEEEQEAERFCLENADGIVHKGPDLEIEFYRNAGYKIKAPVLQFQDYCTERFIVRDPLPKLSEKDGKIHIVYTGAVASMNASPKFAGHAQFGRLAQVLASQNIHFHIYADPYLPVDLSWYKDFAQRTPYFHLHDSLPIGELTREISQYDYGAWIHFVEETALTQECRKSAMGNKLFTYLEAGLPIIINDEILYGCNLLNKYGIGIVLKAENMDRMRPLLEQADYSGLIDRVRKSRETLSMKNQLHRLEAFYASIWNG